MIYVFHNNQLHYQGEEYPFDSIPQFSHVYHSTFNDWAVKYERNYLRPIRAKHIPKEVKVLCLLYGIPLPK